MILITIFANCAALAAFQPLPEHDSSKVNEELVSGKLLLVMQLIFKVSSISYKIYFTWILGVLIDRLRDNNKPAC